MRKELSRDELERLHSVLRRAAERAERARDAQLAEKLARELAAIDYEMRLG